MPYKISPTPSIDIEGIEVHIDAFFTKRGLPHRYQDVVRLKNTKIGKRKVSPQQAADELGVKSRETIIKWWRKIDASS